MILNDLDHLAHDSTVRGIHIIGKAKGAWLWNTMHDLQPQQVLELGTANGYSGCILGSTGAHLTTIERDNHLAHEAKGTFAHFNINATVIIGDALTEIKRMTTPHKNFFDVIFIDFAKRSYFQALNACKTMVKHGGRIIADNITMEGCTDYRNAVTTDTELETTIINIKDGLSCSKRVCAVK